MKTEVIDILNPGNKCNFLPDFPLEKVSKASGGLMEQKPMVCGGLTGDGEPVYDCYSLNQTGWTKLDITVNNHNAQSIPINNNGMWMTGGVEENPLKTSFVSPTRVQDGPDMLKGLVDHCVVKVIVMGDSPSRDLL
jgi:hypothetical protein